MDKLDVIREAEARGGTERRQALIDLMIHARNLGCNAQIGGGRVGGINLRYGSIGHAIMDVNTRGQVKLYVDPHPGRSAPKPLWKALNACIESMPNLDPKTFPIQSYGVLKSRIEEIPADQLHTFVAEAVSAIWDTYYQPHIAH